MALHSIKTLHLKGTTKRTKKRREKSHSQNIWSKKSEEECRLKSKEENENAQTLK